MELPLQTDVFAELVIVGPAVEIPVNALVTFVTAVEVSVWVTVFVAPNFTHGNVPVYSPVDMFASVPTTSPGT